jgi:hypothetical protein
MRIGIIRLFNGLVAPIDPEPFARCERVVGKSSPQVQVISRANLEAAAASSRSTEAAHTRPTSERHQAPAAPIAHPPPNRRAAASLEMAHRQAACSTAAFWAVDSFLPEM